MDATSDDIPPEEVSAADLALLARDFEQVLRKQSTFSSSTLKLYAEKIRRDDGDPRLIERIAHAVQYRREAPDALAHGEGSSTLDLDFFVEMWQENDRQAHKSVFEPPTSRPTDTDSPSPSVGQKASQTFDSTMKELQEQQKLSKARSSSGYYQRYMAIPDPFLPCIRNLDDLEQVHISQLKFGDHNRDRAVILRRVGNPIYRRDRTLVVGVDDTGGEILLELTGIYAIFESTTLSMDAEFAIKEPYVTTGRDVPFCISVYHPSDVVRLQEPVNFDLKSTRREWKERGNAMFKSRKFGDAAHAYEVGLGIESDEADLESDLHRNLAQAYLHLGLYDAAKAHADSSIEHQKSSAAVSPGTAGNEASTLDCDERQKSNDAKACYRAAKAAYRLRDFTSARLALEEMLTLTPEDKDGKQELVKVYKRLNEELNAAYDFDDIISKTSIKQPEVDVANFTLRTLKRSSAGKGNGLFAARDFEIGDLVLCEKAYSSDFATGAKTDVLRTFNRGTDTFSHASTNLWIKTLEEAYSNPSRASILMSLGGAYEGLGSQDIRADGCRVIDSFQVHDIVTRNAFGIPSPNPQARTQAWGLYSAQSSDGSTSIRTDNYALFCHMALINHSCLPNVDKRFIGDLIIIRAMRPIKKREEILLDYTPAGYDDQEEFDTMYERTWQFKCDCKLCEAARKEDISVRRRRMELSNEAKDLASDLSSRLPESPKFTKEILRLEKLLDQVNSTYDPKFYSGLPRQATTYVLVSLATIYGYQRDSSKTATAMRKAFGSLGWESPLEAGGKLVPLPGHTSFLNLNIPHLLHLTVLAAERSKRMELASAVKKLERQVYLALNGVMNGFNGTDERK